MLAGSDSNGGEGGMGEGGETKANERHQLHHGWREVCGCSLCGSCMAKKLWWQTRGDSLGLGEGRALIKMKMGGML
jgi:hypothetical protein